MLDSRARREFLRSIHDRGVAHTPTVPFRRRFGYRVDRNYTLPEDHRETFVVEQIVADRRRQPLEELIVEFAGESLPDIDPGLELAKPPKTVTPSFPSGEVPRRFFKGDEVNRISCDVPEARQLFSDSVESEDTKRLSLSTKQAQSPFSKVIPPAPPLCFAPDVMIDEPSTDRDHSQYQSPSITSSLTPHLPEFRRAPPDRGGRGHVISLKSFLKLSKKTRNYEPKEREFSSKIMEL